MCNIYVATRNLKNGSETRRSCLFCLLKDMAAAVKISVCFQLHYVEEFISPVVKFFLYDFFCLNIFLLWHFPLIQHSDEKMRKISSARNGEDLFGAVDLKQRKLWPYEWAKPRERRAPKPPPPPPSLPSGPIP